MSGKKSRQSLAPKPVTSSNSETLPLGMKIKKKTAAEETTEITA